MSNTIKLNDLSAIISPSEDTEFWVYDPDSSLPKDRKFTITNLYKKIKNFINTEEPTLNLNISGNAQTVTNGMYLAGNQVVSGEKEFVSLTKFNDVVIEGDLFVNGTQTILNTQTLSIEDNIIELNRGLPSTSSPISSLISGVSVNRGASKDYRFIFREIDNTFVIGEVDEEQAVATREDNPKEGGVAYWNDSEKRFETSEKIIFLEDDYEEYYGSELYLDANLTVFGDINFSGQLFQNGNPFFPSNGSNGFDGSLIEINTGDGLLGGGDLTENRTLQVDSSVVRTLIEINTGDGLLGGGDLTKNRTLQVDSSVVRTFGNQTIIDTKTFQNILIEEDLTVLGDINFSGQLFQNGNLFFPSNGSNGSNGFDGSLIEINTGDGLLGGGDLTENRTLQVNNTVTRFETYFEGNIEIWNASDGTLGDSVEWSPELGIFVTVSYGGNYVDISTDGINWTSETIEANNVNYEWNDITWSPELGIFVIVSENFDSKANVVITSPDGINWTGRAAQIGNWRSVVWSPELEIFVAVASSGDNKVMTSTNGINWTAQSAPLSSWISVVWSKELEIFVAVGATNLVMTSPDGITWTAITAAPSNNVWNSVEWSPELGIFVAVASSDTNRVMTSPDGITWTERSVPLSEWYSVEWSPELGIFVAVASNGPIRVMTSPDGINWTAITVEESVWRSVVWSPELEIFVAVADTGTNRVMTSGFTSYNNVLAKVTDVLNPNYVFEEETEVIFGDWTARTAAEQSTWQSVVWSKELNIFVAVARTGTNKVMTSEDGINWTARSAPFSFWRSVEWSPELGIFAAVGSGGLTEIVITSPDGINWTSRTAPSVQNAPENIWTSVEWSPELGIFVAVASNGPIRVMTSEDGINWTARNAPFNSAWTSVEWSPELGIFVAVARFGDNKVMTSTNGINWTARTVELSDWRSVVWSPELGIFVAVASSDTNRVMTSPDGINWTAITVEESSWYSVVWSPELGIFVAVAIFGDNRVMTSPDGINWTARTAAEQNVWYSVEWSPELGIFVAVAESGTNLVMTSQAYIVVTETITNALDFNIKIKNLTVLETLTELSSIKIKKNIKPIENALETITKLQGVTYDRIDGTKTNEVGLIAEEVEKLIPSLVSYDNKGNVQGLNYSRLVAYLIEAVKELQEVNKK